MQGDRFVPDVVLYAAVAKNCVKRGELSEAHSVWRQLWHSGGKPDEVM